jgi:two-component system nitrate/nitrite response regulator NarL
MTVFLKPKERKIVRLVARGLNNEDIAKAIGNTKDTTKNYLRAIMDKTGMSTRLELALWWLGKGYR